MPTDNPGSFGPPDPRPFYAKLRVNDLVLELTAAEQKLDAIRRKVTNWLRIADDACDDNGSIEIMAKQILAILDGSSGGQGGSA